MRIALVIAALIAACYFTTTPQCAKDMAARGETGICIN